MEKPTVLIAGCGDLGQRLYTHLKAAGIACHGLRRNVTRLPAGIMPLRADYLQPASLSLLAGLAPDYLVLILKPSHYDAQGYWEGFVQAARNIVAAVDCQSLRRIVVVSSTRVYAESQGSWVDEDSPLESAHFASAALLAMEAELAEAAPTTALRCGGIYGDPDGMLLSRVRRGEFSALRPTVYGNRIHRDDAAAALAHVLHLAEAGQPLLDAYNVVDQDPAPQAVVERFIAALMHLPVPPEPIEGGRPPRETGHKRVSSARLLASGFALRYPDYRSGYAAVLDGSGAA